jgi:hypothetical protein
MRVAAKEHKDRKEGFDECCYCDLCALLNLDAGRAVHAAAGIVSFVAAEHFLPPDPRPLSTNSHPMGFALHPCGRSTQH